MIWRIVQFLGPRIALKLKLILMNKKENRPTFMTAESFTNGEPFLFITLQNFFVFTLSGCLNIKFSYYISGEDLTFEISCACHADHETPGG